MAKRAKPRKTAGRARKKLGRSTKSSRKAAPKARKASKTRSTRRSGKRQTSTGAKASTRRRTVKKPVAKAAKGLRSKPARLNRPRRLLEEVVPTPPSSLNMNRRGSAARTGRAELEESLTEHPGMTPAITGGDVDAAWEQAYFTGDEAPGGDNPTPDQEVVEDIGKSLGVEYQDNEELQSSDKVAKRDKHRWELDPASAEDYKERK